MIVTSPLFAGPASGSPALVRGLRSPRCRYEPWRPERIRSPRVETAGRPGCSRMSWPGWLRLCAQRSSRAGPGQAAARQIKSDGPGGAARRSDRQCFSDLHTTKYRMPDNPSPWRWMSSLPPAGRGWGGGPIRLFPCSRRGSARGPKGTPSLPSSQGKGEGTLPAELDLAVRRHPSGQPPQKGPGLGQSPGQLATALAALQVGPGRR
jgi:hypothetical protein